MKNIYFLLMLFSALVLNAQTNNISIQPKNEKDKEIIMLDKIVVTGKLRKSKVFESSMPMNVIDKKELEKEVPMSMSDVFKKQPGLDVSSTGPNSVRPMIRGLYDDRILIMLNNIRISEQRGGGSHILSIDPAQIRSVEAVRGPATVLYGTDAIAGVMNIIPKQAEINNDKGIRFHGENSLSYEGSSSGWKNSTICEGGKDSFNFLGQFIYKDTGDIETFDGKLKNSFYEGIKAVGSANYVWDKGYVSGYYYHSKADIGIPNYNKSRNMDFKKSYFDGEKHNMVILNFEKNDISQKLKIIKIDTAYQLHNRHMNILNPANANFDMKAEIFLDIATWTFNPHTIIKLSKNNILTTGINFFREDAESDRIFRKLNTDGTITITPYDGVGVIPDANRTGLGIFIQNEISAGKKLNIIPGIRYDMIHVECKKEEGHPVSPAKKDDKAVSCNLGMLYNISSKFNFTVNLGRAFRAPTLLERFFYGPHQAAYDKGNPSLKPEISYNIDTGVKVRTKKFWTTFSLFFNYLDEYIKTYKTGEQTVSGDDIYSWDNVSEARLYGGEVAFNLRVVYGFSIFNNTSYVRGEDIKKNENLPAISPLKTFYGIRYSKELTTSMNGYIELNAKSTAAQVIAAPDENRTHGYTIFGIGIGLKIKYITITVKGENLGDKSYHNHLSRINWINEQPGRHVKANVTVKF